GATVSVMGEVLHEARRQQSSAEARTQRIAGLQAQLESTASAAGSERAPRLAEIVVGQGCALLGASACRLALFDEDGSALRTAHAVPTEAVAGEAIDLEADE